VPSETDETRRLRDLHEDYAWQVNAVVAENREDLLRRLPDEYLAKAMQVMTDARPTAGEGAGGMSGRPRPAGGRPRFFPAWLWRRLHR